MPHSDLHKRRQAKNWAVMGGLCGFVVLVFVITIVKMMVAGA